MFFLPPSKSLLVWRMMLDKLPTYEILASIGCNLPSICSLCRAKEESSFHLFFECWYAVKIWRWFASILNCNLHFQSRDDIWSICQKPSNPQGKLVITVTLINIFSVIWFARNQTRFNNISFPWRSSISQVLFLALLYLAISHKLCPLLTCLILF